MLNFSLNWQFWVFGPNSPKAGCLKSKPKKKKKKWTQSLSSAYSNYSRLSYSLIKDNKYKY